MWQTGSSPPTRGARHGGVHVWAGDRIIPAYAGSTRSERIRTLCGADHPRLRGEHSHISVMTAHGCGSSPPTRGARTPCAPKVPGHRIIHAYAGSTRSPGPPPAQPTDHPRLRGEHRQCSIRHFPQRGSSPPTRGARSDAGTSFKSMRIIPAYAGSTTGRSAKNLRQTDHPRLRGEHSARLPAGSRQPGSSPPTRGAR